MALSIVAVAVLAQRWADARNELMQRVAELIPPERRGYYSDDPAIREAAKGTEIYEGTNEIMRMVVAREMLRAAQDNLE